MNNELVVLSRLGTEWSPAAVIGNVNEQSVQEIWDGYVAKQLRKILDDGRRDLIHLCSRCNAYGDYDFSKFEANAEKKAAVEAQ